MFELDINFPVFIIKILHCLPSRKIFVAPDFAAKKKAGGGGTEQIAESRMNASFALFDF